MPCSTHHPLALFSLRPYNDDKQRAKGVVEDVRNGHLVSAHPEAGFVLDVGFNIRSKSSAATLATLGRGDTNIHISGGSIARTQCSFEIDEQTGIVMLYDRSHGQTTQVFGDFATPFEPGRARKVVVQKGLNTIIGMGGVGQNLVMFGAQSLRIRYAKIPPQLGAGTYGAVYRAVDVDSGKLIAVKIMK
jgi:hypothetical protein